jgi:transposase
MSGPLSSSRFEVIASTRRAFTPEQKAAMVAEIERGGTLSDVARRHTVHTSLLCRWRRELAARQTSSTPAFLPVTCPRELPPTPPRVPPSTKIEIELRNGRTLRVDADVDVAAVQRLVAALETA